METDRLLSAVPVEQELHDCILGFSVEGHWYPATNTGSLHKQKEGGTLAVVCSL